jgi:hypothetical protein
MSKLLFTNRSVAPTTYKEETGTLKRLPSSVLNKPVAAIRTSDLDALYASQPSHDTRAPNCYSVS